ncbi:hypothetical protein JW868_03670 [Candidatus Woesearchaeota archaeon]|nr:hypothetical protein [Candidatus Woesearchaeota archaeon]
MVTVNYSELTKIKTLKIMLSMLRASKKELGWYEQYREDQYLIQSSEKTWNCIVQWVCSNEMNSGRMIPQSHEAVVQGVYRLPLKIEAKRKIAKFAQDLHRNFYKGDFSYRQVKERVEYLLGTLESNMASA